MASFLCANTACLFQLIVESSPSHNTAAKSILTRLRHPHASNLKPTIPAKDLATVIVSRSQITYTKTDLLRFYEAGWNFRGLRPWSHQNAGCCLVHSRSADEQGVSSVCLRKVSHVRRVCCISTNFRQSAWTTTRSSWALQTLARDDTASTTDAWPLCAGSPITYLVSA